MTFSLVLAVLVALGLLSAAPAQAAGSGNGACGWNMDSTLKDSAVKDSAAWNMQGANHATENKWNIGVTQLMGTCQVLALQEPGALPDSVTALNTINLPQGDVEVSEWNNTSRNLGYRIYWMNTDPNSNRVHLAIVVPASLSVTGVTTFTKPGWNRPVMGILIGNTWYFTVHANASSPNNAQGILSEIDYQVHQYEIEHDTQFTWIALGDFNTSPSSFAHTAASGWVMPPNGPTHNANLPNPHSVYDYAATTITHSSMYQGQVQHGIHLSDHYPVHYPGPFFSTSAGGASTSNGTGGASTSNGATDICGYHYCGDL
ncbi:MAG: endonuclease/exonuclease/phosphatase family protein [Dermatophilaceae bacterium]